nr:hypothetical protein GCM10020092_004850 [Actinoplanes digitatis]
MTAWLTAFLAAQPGAGAAEDLAEAVALELTGSSLTRHDSAAALTATVGGLLGAHPRIVDRAIELRLDEVLTRTGEFRAVAVLGVPGVPEAADRPGRRRTRSAAARRVQARRDERLRA